MLLADNGAVAPSHGRHRVLVYRGEGASPRLLKATTQALQSALPGSYEVRALSCEELLKGAWTASASLLVMPGGADLPYCAALNGRGNRLIADYVRRGGAYLGLCAGAYYACSRVQFEPASALEVVGCRELGFFPGIARGAAYAGFDYHSEAGAAAADITFQVPRALLQQQQQQQQHALAADVMQALGPAQPGHTWEAAVDYSNGGPVFLTQQGTHDLEQLPGVTVLARYANLPPRPELEADAAGGADGADGTEGSNNGSSAQQQQQHDSNRVAATMPAAAVRCQVGLGVAVLCGTHPELAPKWLLPCGQQAPQPVSAAAVPAGAMLSEQQQQQLETACPETLLAAHVASLHSKLSASQAQRQLFLSCMLYNLLRRPE